MVQHFFLWDKKNFWRNRATTFYEITNEIEFLENKHHRGLRRGLRDDAPKCCEQYIKSDFVLFWGPDVLWRSNFDTESKAQPPQQKLFTKLLE